MVYGSDKLRKFASLYGANLRRVAKVRFGSQSNEHLAWMLDLYILNGFCAFAGRFHFDFAVIS